MYTSCCVHVLSGGRESKVLACLLCALGVVVPMAADSKKTAAYRDLRSNYDCGCRNIPSRRDLSLA